MHEFEFIASLMAPLAAGDNAALALTDDAALLSVPPGKQLVVSKDAIVEGVHFTGQETPAQIAQKLLRVNLSDLAAMGAVPYGYFLALMLPKSTNEAWLTSFAQGLRADQEAYGLTLLGGDTTHTSGPLCLSATMMGMLPSGQALLRSGAKPGDAIYISGTVGDAAIGLGVAQKASRTDHDLYFLDRYHLPQPRVKLGEALRLLATACMDVSDGLLQDLGHMARHSEVSATIHLAHIPLSAQARTVFASMKDAPARILAGGDDYELLFTAPPAAEAKLSAIAKTSGTQITRIGEITAGSGVRALDAGGAEMNLGAQGYQHF